MIFPLTHAPRSYLESAAQSLYPFHAGDDNVMGRDFVLPILCRVTDWTLPVYSHPNEHVKIAF